MNDSLDHVAIHVADIEAAVAWYTTSFSCEVIRQDAAIAVLRFSNIELVLTLPSQEPPHIGFVREDASTFGELRMRPDGRTSTYLSDSTGNVVEIAKKTS